MGVRKRDITTKVTKRTKFRIMFSRLFVSFLNFVVV
jgi:hypothetical protein